MYREKHEVQRGNFNFYHFSYLLFNFFQIAKREHFEAWNGALLKLSVKCGNNEPRCVLLKLQSLPGYNVCI